MEIEYVLANGIRYLLIFIVMIAVTMRKSGKKSLLNYMRERAKEKRQDSTERDRKKNVMTAAQLIIANKEE